MLGGSEFCLRQGFLQKRKRLHDASAPPRPAGPHTLLASMLFGRHKDRQTSPEVCRSFLSSFPTSRHPMGQTAIFSLAFGRYSPCDIHRNVRYFRDDEREQPIKSHHLTAKRLNLRTKRCSLFSLGITVQMYNKLLDSFLGFLCLGCNLIPAFWASPDTFHDALFHFRSTIQTRPVSFPRFVSQFSRLCLAVYSDDKLRNRKKNSPKSTPYKRNLVPGWRS